jgi:hypothetical protein
VSTESPLLTATEPGRRNRRTVDGIFLLAAAVVIGLTAVIASATPEVDVSAPDLGLRLFAMADSQGLRVSRDDQTAAAQQ